MRPPGRLIPLHKLAGQRPIGPAQKDGGGIRAVMGHPNRDRLTRTPEGMSVPDQPMEADRPTTPATGGAALQPPCVDLVTVAAVAVVVYTFSSILHEALGHGLTCVLLGGKVACIASTVCIPAGEPLGQGADRLVAAAGSAMNLVAAGVCWVLLRRLRTAPPFLRYFLWLSLAVNGFIGAGYLAVPTLIGFGDWMNVLEVLHSYWLWRATIIGLGVVLYGAVAYVAVRELQPFLSRDASERRSRATKLTLIPYLAGGLAFCAAGLFNPVGMKLVVISAAAASFGGTSGLAWLTWWATGTASEGQTPEPPVALGRNWWWLVLGIANAAVLLGLLGRGVRFGP